MVLRNISNKPIQHWHQVINIQIIKFSILLDGYGKIKQSLTYGIGDKANGIILIFPINPKNSQIIYIRTAFYHFLAHIFTIAMLIRGNINCPFFLTHLRTIMPHIIDSPRAQYQHLFILMFMPLQIKNMRVFV